MWCFTNTLGAFQTKPNEPIQTNIEKNQINKEKNQIKRGTIKEK
jgi:hypothetical protein